VARDIADHRRRLLCRTAADGLRREDRIFLGWADRVEIGIDDLFERR
jgi:hypothetical protein